MGYYKSLITLAEEGNRAAILQVAEMYRDKERYQQALHWYSQINKTKEIEELTKMLNGSNCYEDEIF